MSIRIGFGTLLLGGALFGAFLSKPNKEHFRNFLRGWFKERMRRERELKGESSGGLGNFVRGFTDLAVGEILARATEHGYQDCVFFSIGTANLSEEYRIVFVGAYNHWFPLEMITI
jgi:hypothetical protein